MVPVHLIPDLVLEQEFLSNVGHHEEDDAAADDEADHQDPVLPSHRDDNEGCDLERIVFLNGPTPASFSFIFSLFQTNKTKFTTNQCEKMSIQYTALGFEPMTF